MRARVWGRCFFLRLEGNGNGPPRRRALELQSVSPKRLLVREFGIGSLGLPNPIAEMLACGGSKILNSFG